MDSDHTVVDLAAVAVVLSRDGHRVVAALADPRLVHRADGLRMSMVRNHDLLAAVAELFFIPLDRFEKTL